jgi:hypothetical protein
VHSKVILPAIEAAESASKSFAKHPYGSHGARVCGAENCILETAHFLMCNSHTISREVFFRQIKLRVEVDKRVFLDVSCTSYIQPSLLLLLITVDDGHDAHHNY